MRRWLAVASVVFLFAGCGGGGGGKDDARDDVRADVPADAQDEVAPETGADVSDDPPQDPAPEEAGGDESSDVADDGTPPDAIVDPGYQPVDVLPDPAFTYAVRQHANRVADSSYLADEPVQYRTPDVLPDLDVRAILAVGDDVWVGTPTGLFRWTEAAGLFQRIALPDEGGRTPPAAIVDMALSQDGATVAIARPDSILFLASDGSPQTGFGGAVTYTSLAFLPDGMLLAGTTTGLYEGLAGGFGPVEGTQGWSVRDVAAVGDRRLALLHDGTVRLDLDAVTLPAEAAGCNAVAGGETAGRVACDTGVFTLGTGGGAASVLFLPRPGELPTDKVRSVVQAGATLLFGHERGASSVTLVPGPGPLAFEHHVSGRWLPSDTVTGVAITADGTRWVATPAGVTAIVYRTRRLADKEASTFDHWMARFWRMDGFLMSDAYTDDEWDPTTWGRSDFDNDGLWTQMGIGALCYAYSITKDEKYYQAARKAMDNMFLQIDVPAVDFQAAGLGRGFVTRSLVRDDEGDLFTSKSTRSNWHLVTYGEHQYYWKDDTSSDETTGHFFGYPLFYDLCAKDDAERAAVADHAGALARYIVEGGYTLRDLDGIPTSFGHFEPTHISIAVDGLEECGYNYSIEDCMGAMYGAGWLNSIEILGHLLSAWHMTGDRYFYDAYDRLIRQYRYDEVAVTSRVAMTVVNRSMQNHSDHELAMLAYATLIRYEPDDTRRAKWIDSLEGLYEYEVAERQPLWAAVVSLAKAGVADVGAAVQTLREMPGDLRDWRVDNTHRRDAIEDVHDRFDDRQWDRVFPYDEIRTMWWNGNPYEMIGGGSGRNHVSPTAFQLAYWAQRYAGILEAPPPR